MAVALHALARPRWRLLLTACAVYGLREGVFLFLIGLLFYINAGSELQLGAFAFLQSVLSSISFYLVSHHLAPTNRLRVGFAGAVLMAAAAFLFLCPLSTWMIVVYGVSIALVLPMFLVPLQSLVFDAILHIEGAGRETEHFIIREGFANLGRVAGISLFLATISDGVLPSRVAALAVGLGFTQMGAWLLLRCGRIGDGLQARAVHSVSWTSTDAPPRLRARGGRAK
jgi:YQGE family putative transporter